MNKWDFQTWAVVPNWLLTSMLQIFCRLLLDVRTPVRSGTLLVEWLRLIYLLTCYQIYLLGKISQEEILTMRIQNTSSYANRYISFLYLWCRHPQLFNLWSNHGGKSSCTHLSCTLAASVISMNIQTGVTFTHRIETQLPPTHASAPIRWSNGQISGTVLQLSHILCRCTWVQLPRRNTGRCSYHPSPSASRTIFGLNYQRRRVPCHIRFPLPRTSLQLQLASCISFCCTWVRSWTPSVGPYNACLHPSDSCTLLVPHFLCMIGLRGTPSLCLQISPERPPYLCRSSHCTSVCSCKPSTDPNSYRRPHTASFTPFAPQDGPLLQILPVFRTSVRLWLF